MNLLMFYIFTALFFLSEISYNIIRETEMYRLGNERQRKSLNTWWHNIQWGNWILFFFVVSYLQFEGVNLSFIKFNLVSMSVWWILFDGLLNMYRPDKRFWKVSKTSGSEIEHWGQPKIKIGLLLFSTIIATGVLDTVLIAIWEFAVSVFS